MKKTILKLKENKYLHIAFVVLVPLLVMLALEVLNKYGVFKSFRSFASSAALFYLLFGVVYAVTGRVNWTVLLCNLGLYTLYIINYYKKLLTGIVLAPSDISLSNQIQGIMNFVSIKMYPTVVISFVLLLLFTVYAFLIRSNFRLMLKARIVLAVVLAMPTAFFSTDTFNDMFLYKNLKASINNTYAESSFLMGYISIMRNESIRVKNVDNMEYGEELMNDIVNNVYEMTKNNKPKNPKQSEKPNIIVIMSEAFVDPTLWSDSLTFSKDPAPNLHKLQKSAASGHIVSPVFGGHTCNTEYEFLTGNSMKFVGLGHIPYQMPEIYLPDTDERALPQVFRQNGYSTIAVHPYYETFFNRNVIYPLIGFDDYIAMEQMENPVYKGQYISDEFFVDQLIKQLDEAEDPLFLFGISMQNHYTFMPDKYDELDISAHSDKLDDFLNAEVTSYTQGIHDADKQLGRLIQYIEDSGQPTILVFFGDHHPMIGNSSYEAYQALGMVVEDELSNWSLEERHKLFLTPYVMWTNTDAELNDIGDISPYFLGPILLESAGLEKNLYFEFLYCAYQELHGMKTDLYIDQDDKYYDEPLDEDKNIINMFYFLQYDRTAGESYSSEEQAKMLK